MRKLLAIFLFITGTSGLYAWERTYGGSENEKGFCVQETFDKGYIIVGAQEGKGVYLIKTDYKGNVIWSRTYPEAQSSSIQETLDKGYVIAGNIYSDSTQLRYPYLIKTNSQGEILWAQTYIIKDIRKGGSIAEIQQTSDGGYITIGSTDGMGETEIFLLKTDQNGDSLWAKTYHPGYWNWGNSVQQTSDKGYIIVATVSPSGVEYCLYILKTDSLGNPLWDRLYKKGRYWPLEGRDIRQLSDGKYAIIGYLTDMITEKSYVWLLKISEEGDTLWTRVFGDRKRNWGFNGQETSDRGFIIVGATADSLEAERDVYLIKTDRNGNLLWSKTFGGSRDDGGYYVQETSDKGFIIVGSTCSYGAGKSDVYLIKTDSLGNSEEEPAVGEMSEREPLFLSITPNPAINETIIRFGGRTFKPSRLSLYDISGRKINELWRGRLNKNYTLRLNKRELPSGIYFLQLETGGYIKREKVIVE